MLVDETAAEGCPRVFCKFAVEDHRCVIQYLLNGINFVLGFSAKKEKKKFFDSPNELFCLLLRGN